MKLNENMIYEVKSMYGLKDSVSLGLGEPGKEYYSSVAEVKISYGEATKIRIGSKVRLKVELVEEVK